MIDFRVPILVAMVAANGGTVHGAQAALAARMAPRWGKTPWSAEQKLSRFFSGPRPVMPLVDFAELLDELGLTVAPR